MILNLLPTLFKTGADVFLKRQETKRLKALADRNYMEKVAKGEIEYKIEQQRQLDNSWRDEWFTILLSMPLLLVFGAIFLDRPDWIIKLKEGFMVLDELPHWYLYALLAAIASSFGLKVTDLAFKKFKK